MTAFCRRRQHSKQKTLPLFFSFGRVFCVCGLCQRSEGAARRPRLSFGTKLAVSSLPPTDPLLLRPSRPDLRLPVRFRHGFHLRGGAPGGTDPALIAWHPPGSKALGSLTRSTMILYNTVTLVNPPCGLTGRRIPGVLERYAIWILFLRSLCFL